MLGLNSHKICPRKKERRRNILFDSTSKKTFYFLVLVILRLKKKVLFSNIVSILNWINFENWHSILESPPFSILLSLFLIHFLIKLGLASKSSSQTLCQNYELRLFCNSPKKHLVLSITFLQMFWEFRIIKFFSVSDHSDRNIVDR